jgi:HPr Serine kinase C-terminal domain
LATTKASLHQNAREEKFEWPRDPLHYRAEFPLRATYYALGLPLEVSTNSREVIAAADESWRAFPRLYDEQGVHIRIGVAESGQGRTSQPPTHRAQRNMVTVVSDAENFAVCDVIGGFAFGWFTPTMVADRDFFRYHFFDLMAGLLLAPKHFAIIHAACVALEGCGVLLCGNSGAGKSTFAFACAQRGWTFISDDAAYAWRKSPSRTVMGNPLFLRLREDAPDLFPHLRGRSAVLRQNGERGFELSTASLPGFATAFQSEIDHLIFLNRSDSGRAELRTLGQDDARCYLENVLEYTLACRQAHLDGADQSEMVLIDEEAREEQKIAVGKLLGGGLYELRYSSLNSAIDCLESLAPNRR